MHTVSLVSPKQAIVVPGSFGYPPCHFEPTLIGLGSYILKSTFNDVQFAQQVSGQSTVQTLEGYIPEDSEADLLQRNAVTAKWGFPSNHNRLIFMLICSCWDENNVKMLSDSSTDWKSCWIQEQYILILDKITLFFAIFPLSLPLPDLGRCLGQNCKHQPTSLFLSFVGREHFQEDFSKLCNIHFTSVISVPSSCCTTF